MLYRSDNSLFFRVYNFVNKQDHRKDLYPDLMMWTTFKKCILVIVSNRTHFSLTRKWVKYKLFLFVLISVQCKIWGYIFSTCIHFRWCYVFFKTTLFQCRIPIWPLILAWLTQIWQKNKKNSFLYMWPFANNYRWSDFIFCSVIFYKVSLYLYNIIYNGRGILFSSLLFCTRITKLLFDTCHVLRG